MNSYLNNRLTQLEYALERWLAGRSHPAAPLYEAIRKTVDEGRFPPADVHFALDHLSESLGQGALGRWLNDSLSQPDTYPQNDTVLCLHAGNLPLVGFQDVLAVLLSGAGYAGKLSRKDPWLIASFIQVLSELYADVPVQVTTDLSTFRGHSFSRWMFAGSRENLDSVTHRMLAMGIIAQDASVLPRTAHFSVAYLPQWDDTQLPDLVEGILRYDGKGCRSVAIVYTNIPLEQVAKKLQDEAAGWMKRNREIPDPGPYVRFRKAYNDAAGIPCVGIGNHLIQEGHAVPDHPEIVYWQPARDIHEPRLTFAEALQEVYGEKATPLQQAQRPPVDWRPDGVNPLSWLLRGVENQRESSTGQTK